MADQCYLIHFDTPYKHARHYLGYSHDLAARLAAHQSGAGARLMEVINQAGITWQLARTWRGGRDLESRLKRQHSGVKLCPICKQVAFLAAIGFDLYTSPLE